MASLDINNISVTVTGFDARVSESARYGLTVADNKGTFTWDANGGILLEKWGNGFSKSIDLRRGGKFCSLSGGSIYLDNCSGLYGFLRENEINLDGSKLEIRYDDKCLFVGVVTGYEHSPSEFTLNYDEPSKYRNAIISRLTDDGKTYYPVLFGRHEMVALVKVGNKIEEITEIPPIEYHEGVARVGYTLGCNTIPLHIANPKAKEKVMEMSHEMARASARGIQLNYYLCCVRGTGKGEARRIIAIGGDNNSGHVYVHLAECPYTTIKDGTDANGSRLSQTFRPYIEAVGTSDYEEAEPEEYEEISVFKFFRVDIRYAANAGGENDVWVDDTELYSYGDGGYSKLDTSAFSKVGKELVLSSDSFADYFSKVNMLVGLKGKNFSLGTIVRDRNNEPESVTGFLGIPYDANWVPTLSYDQKLYHRISVMSNDSWYPSSRHLPSEPNDVPAIVYSWGSSFDVETPSIAYAKRKYLQDASGFDDDVFADTHSTKIQLRVDYSGAFGIPFEFEFERPDGVDEIMINYDIVITLIPKDNSVNMSEFVKVMSLGSQYAINQFAYNLVTTLVGDNEIYSETKLIRGNGELVRSYLLDEIKTETFRTWMENGRTIRENAIRIQRINTCYNLKDFEDEILTASHWLTGATIIDRNKRDTCYEALKYNGNFWRQDVHNVQEFIKIQQVSTPDYITNYISGYEAIRNGGNGGSGWVKIPDVFADSDANSSTLRFRALLAGFCRYFQEYSTSHIIEFKNIQCLVKKELSINDATIYSSTSGGYDAAWSDAYEMALERQNYSAAHHSEFTCPADGWGTASSGNGRAYNSVIGTDPQYWTGLYIRRQLVTAQELETQNIKNDLLRTAWRGGYIDSLGRECIFDMLLEPAAHWKRSEITYKNIVPGTLGKIGSIPKEDIYCEPFLLYNYDIGPASFTGAIRVMRTDLDAFDEVSPERCVSGGRLTLAQRKTLWYKGRSLYKRYGGALNTPPQTLTENKWIYQDEDAYQYLVNWFDWMGEGEESIERREVNFSLPIRVAIEKEIDIGRSIDIEIPYMQSSYTGLITSVSWQFDRGREEVRCKAFIKMPAVSSYVWTRIVSFTYSPNPVYGDDTLTLYWTTYGAVDADIAGLGPVETSGSVEVPLVVAEEPYMREFTLTVRDHHGNEVSETLTVEVLGVFMIEGHLTVDPNNWVVTPAYRDVSWDAHNAGVQEVVVSDNVSGVISSTAFSGIVKSWIDRDRVYTLRAYKENRRKRGTLVRYVYKFEGIDVSAWVRGVLGVSRPAPVVPVPPAGVMTETAVVKAAGIIVSSITGVLGNRRLAAVIPVPPDGVVTEEDVAIVGIMLDSISGALGNRRAAPIIPVPPDGVMVENFAPTAGIIIDSVSGALGARRAAPIIPVPPDGVMVENFAPTAGIIIETISGALGARS